MAIHGHILHNGEIKAASEPGLFAGQLGLLSGWGVFSTLRVHKGQLFAWERHWARMSRDARALNIPMPADPDRLEHDLMKLIEANDIVAAVPFASWWFATPVASGKVRRAVLRAM
jgi:branched-chain amino acid aminotransferase